MLPIEQLSRVEKSRMMEALWDDLSRDESSLASPAWHGGVLREAEESLASGDASFNWRWSRTCGIAG